MKTALLRIPDFNKLEIIANSAVVALGRQLDAALRDDLQGPSSVVEARALFERTRGESIAIEEHGLVTLNLLFLQMALEFLDGVNSLEMSRKRVKKHVRR